MNLLIIIVCLPLVGAVSQSLLKIMNDEKLACLASYISPKLAMTSASCLFPYRRKMNSLRVMFHKNSRRGMFNNYDDESIERTRMTEHSKTRITFVYVPKEWRWGDTYMDVAIVKLEKSLSDESGHTVYVPLCSKPLDQKDSMEVVACDATENGDVQVQSFSVPNKMNCVWIYNFLVLRYNWACGKGFDNSTKCMFNKGCPLSFGGELCGILAWSPLTCKHRLPAVFTDIFEARHFIRKTFKSEGMILPERRITTERPTTEKPTMKEWYHGPVKVWQPIPQRPAMIGWPNQMQPMQVVPAINQLEPINERPAMNRPRKVPYVYYDGEQHRSIA